MYRIALIFLLFCSAFFYALNADVLIINSIKTDIVEGKNQKSLRFTFQCDSQKCKPNLPEITKDNNKQIIKFTNIFYKALKDSNNQVIKTAIGNIDMLQKDNNLYLILQDKNLKVTYNDFTLTITKLDLIENIISSNQTIKANTPTKSIDDYNISTTKYATAIVFMLLIILALFIVRKRVTKYKNVSSMDYKQTKIIDSKNKIIVIDYKNKSYILGVNPNGIVLIDKMDIDSEERSQREKNQDVKNEFKNLLKQRDGYIQDL